MRTFEESSKLMSYDSAASAQQGLRLGQFIPHFQPIVALRTGQLAGFEILARWYHPQRGLVLPDQFISLAEKQGWIHSLTLELLRKAFEAARSIPEPLTLSINISPVQLRTPGLPALVRKAAEETGFRISGSGWKSIFSPAGNLVGTGAAIRATSRCRQEIHRFGRVR